MTIHMTSYKSRTRLLFLVPSLQTGGAERQLVQLVQHLDKERYQITVATIDVPNHQGDSGFYTQVQSLPTVQLVTLGRRSRFHLLRPLMELLKILDDQKIHLMHSFLHFAGAFAMVASHLREIPVVASSIRSNRDTKLINRLSIYAQSVGCSLLVSNSTAGLDNRFKQWRSNFRVIPNGIDFSRFRSPENIRYQLRAELGLTRFDHIVGMVARLAQSKDHSAFLQMAKRVLMVRPNTGFLVVGNGPQRRHLEDLTRKLGITEQVIFTGQRNDTDLLTGLFDIACLFSNIRTMEGMPNTVMEAMACGVPVVATYGGGTTEIMTDGREGYLIVDNNVEEGSRRILELLADPRLRLTMGEHGKTRIQKKFDMYLCIASYEILYQQLLA